MSDSRGSGSEDVGDTIRSILLEILVSSESTVGIDIGHQCFRQYLDPK
jgi:hypothetical protein